MSLFSSVAKWFISTGITEAAKQAAAKQLTQAAAGYAEAIEIHAPDLAAQLTSQLATHLAAAVGGALSRTK